MVDVGSESLPLTNARDVCLAIHADLRNSHSLLNGLIVEQLGEIPDAGTTFELAGQGIEILHVQDRAVKVVKLVPPVGRTAPPALQTSGEQASSIS